MRSIIALVTVIFALGFVAGYWSARDRYEMPNCPNEDSCHADYSGGAWHIIPVQP